MSSCIKACITFITHWWRVPISIQFWCGADLVLRSLRIELQGLEQRIVLGDVGASWEVERPIMIGIVNEGQSSFFNSGV